MTWRGTGRDRASAHRRGASYTEVHPLRVPGACRRGHRSGKREEGVGETSKEKTK